MREGLVVRPEGNRGTLLTDWRPDRLHCPHSIRSGEPLFYAAIFQFHHNSLSVSGAPLP